MFIPFIDVYMLYLLGFEAGTCATDKVIDTETTK
jgi:hypothetical protein